MSVFLSHHSYELLWQKWKINSQWNRVWKKGKCVQAIPSQKRNKCREETNKRKKKKKNQIKLFYSFSVMLFVAIFRIPYEVKEFCYFIEIWHRKHENPVENHSKHFQKSSEHKHFVSIVLFICAHTLHSSS